MDFIWSYKIADFVQYLLALQKITRLMDFIRSGGVCKISTSLAKIYNNYELYKVWQPLYDIDLPYKNYQHQQNQKVPTLKGRLYTVPQFWGLHGRAR